ncbi:MAG: hypothetical protein ACRDE8_04370 [Ginsengibacter sp.]
MLEKEFQYYLKHQDSLVKKYNGKFIVIKDEKVIGVYNSHSEAYNESLKKEVLGTFLIQHCLPGADSHSQTFHSQVIIHAVN